MVRLALAFLIALGASAASAGSIRLETANEARGWQGVGRLDIRGLGFCTGALIEPDVVLTAAHCMFDRRTGERFDPTELEFRAGWRNGRAAAYRGVRQVVIHPDYRFSPSHEPAIVRNDLALLVLDRPIRSTEVSPFAVGPGPAAGESVAVVSYAFDRAEAPTLQDHCTILGRQDGILLTDCTVDFGSSGSPVFSLSEAGPRIVSIVSAKAEARGQPVSLGIALGEQIGRMLSLTARLRNRPVAAVGARRVLAGEARADIGARFVRP